MIKERPIIEQIETAAAKADEIRQRRNQFRQQHHLGYYQGLILILIQAKPGLTPSELAQLLHSSKPRVSGLTAKLISKGYVDDVQNQVDRRVHQLMLTPAGVKVTETIAPSLTVNEDEPLML